MKQPKVYVKKYDKIFDVIEIHFDINVVYFDDGIRDGYMSLDFDEVEFIYNTGYKDMNGNYIYTGDILECQGEANKYYVRKVLVEQDGEKEFHYLTNNWNFVFRLIDMFDYAVIGNIHENKELLED